MFSILNSNVRLYLSGFLKTRYLVTGAFISIREGYNITNIKIKEEPTGKMTINVKEIANEKMVVASKYTLDSETEVTINQSKTPKYYADFNNQLLSE